MKAQAVRTRPEARIEFSQPLIGATGAKLLAYEWQWKLDLVIDCRGEAVEKRVSDWDRSADSAATGRQIVHQFDVDGQLVSAESALKLLGFAGDQAKPFKARASAAKTLARLTMQLAQLQQVEAQWQADWAEVEALELPQVVVSEWEQTDWGAKRRWTLGDAHRNQDSNSNGCEADDEVMRGLISDWRAKRMEQRNWSWSYELPTRAINKFRFDRNDLLKRIDRAKAKL